MFSFGRKTLLAVVAVLMFFGLTINAEAKEIRVGYLVADQLHFPAIMVMKERNMLEKEGYTVKWSEFLAGSYVMQEMASGSLDFVSCGAVAKSCKMDVDITKNPNHAECIRCGMCMKACPTDAICYRYGLGDKTQTTDKGETI